MSRRRDDWEATRLKYIADCNVRALPEDADPDLEFTYVDISNVAQGTMNLESAPIRFGDSPSRARRIAAAGDTVVSTVRTYLRAVATVPETDRPLVFSTGFAVLHPRPTVHPAFLAYYLQGDEFVDRVVASSTGVSYPAITATDLVRLSVRLPNLQEQGAIAAYLDRETTKVDALISEQEGLVQVLRERRAAVIEHVLRSANPTTAGQRLKHVVASATQGWSPQCYPWPADGVETWGVLKAGAANGGVFRPMENKELPHTESPRPEVVARRGQLVVSRANTRELVGSAAVVDGHYPRLMLCDKLYAFDLHPKRALPLYVALTLGTRRWRDLIELEASGSSPSMQNISYSDIVNLPMDLPTVEEQRRVLDALAEQTKKTDGLIAEAEGVVAVAKERRTALITAAVTGQIDVRGEVA